MSNHKYITIKLKWRDGTDQTIYRGGFGHGIGTTAAEAESELLANKSARRLLRGEQGYGGRSEGIQATAPGSEDHLNVPRTEADTIRAETPSGEVVGFNKKVDRRRKIEAKASHRRGLDAEKISMDAGKKVCRVTLLP